MCFGGPDFSVEERRLIASLMINPDMVVHRKGPDELLKNYYHNAELFVFPSLYEGFGLPLLEAMRENCAVACSQTSSLPEVAGNAAILFDPLSYESIRDALENLIQHSDLRKQLIELGAIRTQEFSWSKTSEQTKKVYESVIRK